MNNKAKQAMNERWQRSKAAREIKSMLEQGMTKIEIARARGVSAAAVQDVCKRYGLVAMRVWFKQPKHIYACEVCGKDIHSRRKRFCSAACLRKGRPQTAAKLNTTKANEIRKKRANGQSLAEIAAEYGVSVGLVGNITKNRAWITRKGHWPKGKSRSDCDASEWRRLLPRVKALLKVKHKNVGSARALGRFVGVDGKTVSRWLNEDRIPMQESVTKIKDWIGIAVTQPASTSLP